MNNQNNIRSVLNNHKIIPVVTFTNKEDIQPIVESLLDQQIKCIEVTLRNSISRDAVEVIKNIYGDKIAVGVGTVLNKSDVLFSQILKFLLIMIYLLVLYPLIKENPLYLVY